ncbi:hypothetical protein TD95_003242 [Thielaviopsis punctulata]|uniref:dolichol kinase n=1 Tax=Thielaviopsis punctulata TaxID=72032 RepID=A0A0F4ZDB4_9PEZI|nr:hypothetical protein TD95_003242 [Thielaviopsis punctulata]
MSGPSSDQQPAGPSGSASASASASDRETTGLSSSSVRLPSRSPHPYLRHNFEVLQQSRASVMDALNASDSGTEADDEHFLRGLPAPKGRLHKGLRGGSGHASGTSTPLVAAETVAEDEEELRRRRRRRVMVRRVAEVVIVTTLAGVVVANKRVKPVAHMWMSELIKAGMVYAALLAAYPLRVLVWTLRNPRATLSSSSLAIPTDFDPAPLLYPCALTILASLLISVEEPRLLVPNIVLALCTLPQDVIPLGYEGMPEFTPSSVHWLVSLAPVMAAGRLTEQHVFLYPLHRALCGVLYSLTMTSLLPAELELLSVALLNVLLFAESPQIKMLRCLLWVGGLCVLLLTGPVILRGIGLARVPKWRFRRLPPRSRSASYLRPLQLLWNPLRLKRELLGPSSSPTKMSASAESDATNSSDESDSLYVPEEGHQSPRWAAAPASREQKREKCGRRRKRTLSTSLKPLVKLTQEQATARKCVYAAYVYAAIAGIILGPVRMAISRDALDGNEAVGWALGYLLGDLDGFRWQVVSHGLERWILLPQRVMAGDACCGAGWVQHVRMSWLGAANARLLIGAYWLLILVVGLLVVFRLRALYEVDTRRKVFHFMMVGMLMPATFVDPGFCAMALSFALAVFLLLDLLRASQLPPLSKPIAAFLAPYVDGRDFRGPVVISHIFLLIGCAIPLWLTLASLRRSDSAGWEMEVRDVSMVAGVVCVGLGDAAASLIGRRYGHWKWYWGGGKSVEGSVAFAMAVCGGLMAASGWMRVGRWPVDEPVEFGRAAGHALGCGTLASLTEAGLTGGNDNVIVPVVLWICVKSVGV